MPVGGETVVVRSPGVPRFGSRDSCWIHLSFTWTAEPAVAVPAVDVLNYRQPLKNRLVPCSGGRLTSSDNVG